MFWNQGIENELRLYYLFMGADGEITEREQQRFDKICKEMNFSDKRKHELISNCKWLLASTNNILQIIIDLKLGEELKHDSDLSMYNQTPEKRGRILWNLITIGYADKCFSIEEKEIVDYFCKELDISKELYTEMIETSETILTLSNHREWIDSKYPEGKERDIKDREILKRISRCFNDIRKSIEELEI